MFIIQAGETKGKWIGNNKKAVGEDKITKFLVERKITLDNHKINDNLYLAPIDISIIFLRAWLREELSKWEADILKDQFESYKEKDLYCKEEPPKTLTPTIHITRE